MKETTKPQLWMFPDEKTCNAEIVRFIASHDIISTDYKDFYCDREGLDMQFFEMDDPGEWYGTMVGVHFITAEGLEVYFGSWFDEEYYINEGEYIQSILDAMFMLTPPNEL